MSVMVDPLLLQTSSFSLKSNQIKGFFTTAVLPYFSCTVTKDLRKNVQQGVGSGFLSLPSCYCCHRTFEIVTRHSSY